MAGRHTGGKDASRMRRPEETIQRAVFQHIAARSMPGVFAWHTPNGGKRNLVEAIKLKRMGTLAGVPDVLILMGGRLYALELKAPKGRLTPVQERVLERMDECGAHTAVVYGLDQALITLEVWGILRREKAAA